MPVFPHSVGNEGWVGSNRGRGMRIISFFPTVPFLWGLPIPFGSPPACPFAWPFLWASIWFSIRSVSSRSNSCSPPSEDTRESGGSWKSVSVSLSRAGPSVCLRASAYSGIPSLLSHSKTSSGDHSTTFFILPGGKCERLGRSPKTKVHKGAAELWGSTKISPVMAHGVLRLLLKRWNAVESVGVWGQLVIVQQTDLLAYFISLDPLLKQRINKQWITMQTIISNTKLLHFLKRNKNHIWSRQTWQPENTFEFHLRWPDQLHIIENH